MLRPAAYGMAVTFPHTVSTVGHGVLNTVVRAADVCQSVTLSVVSKSAVSSGVILKVRDIFEVGKVEVMCRGCLGADGVLGTWSL